MLCTMLLLPLMLCCHGGHRVDDTAMLDLLLPCRWPEGTLILDNGVETVSLAATRFKFMLDASEAVQLRPILML